MARFAEVAALLQGGVGTTYPAAALSCGRDGVEFYAAAGAATDTTWFDLASLTKALCTSVLVMRQHGAGKLDLDQLVPIGAAQQPVRLWQLLAHCSGLPAGPPPLWAEEEGLLDAPSDQTRQRVVHMAATTPPGPAAQKSLYSDLGFIVLGDLLERRVGKRLDEQFGALAAALEVDIAFRPLDHPSYAAAATRCAATRRESAARELLHGQVHDDNARAMLGVAGHAGLFGTAAAVQRFAVALLDAYHDTGSAAQRALAIPSATVRRFFAACTGPSLHTTWGLGWDHPDPLPADGSPSTSSAGSLWPRTGVGHLGFTGCSLWLDLDRRGVCVFLSNRVNVATNDQAAASKALLKALRPAINDAVQRAFRLAD